jgi:hypothetical protein
MDYSELLKQEKNRNWLSESMLKLDRTIKEEMDLSGEEVDIDGYWSMLDRLWYDLIINEGYRDFLKRLRKKDYSDSTFLRGVLIYLSHQKITHDFGSVLYLLGLDEEKIVEGVSRLGVHDEHTQRWKKFIEKLFKTNLEGKILLEIKEDLETKRELEEEVKKEGKFSKRIFKTLLKYGQMEIKFK